MNIMDQDKAYDALYTNVVQSLTPEDGDEEAFVERVWAKVTNRTDDQRLRNLVEIDFDEVDQAIEDVREDRYSAYEESRIG